MASWQGDAKAVAGAGVAQAHPLRPQRVRTGAGAAVIDFVARYQAIEQNPSGGPTRLFPALGLSGCAGRAREPRARHWDRLSGAPSWSAHAADELPRHRWARS